MLGREFGENALAIDAERDGVRLAGFVGIPSFNRGNALHQFAYVNGRPVRDKQIFGALRGAYSDVIARDRAPGRRPVPDTRSGFGGCKRSPGKGRCALSRSGLVRGLIVGAIKQALAHIRHSPRHQRRGSNASGLSR